MRTVRPRQDGGSWSRLAATYIIRILVVDDQALRRWRLPFGNPTTGFSLALLMHPPAIPAELSAAT